MWWVGWRGWFRLCSDAQWDSGSPPVLGLGCSPVQRSSAESELHRTLAAPGVGWRPLPVSAGSWGKHGCHYHTSVLALPVPKPHLSKPSLGAVGFTAELPAVRLLLSSARPLISAKPGQAPVIHGQQKGSRLRAMLGHPRAGRAARGQRAEGGGGAGAWAVALPELAPALPSAPLLGDVARTFSPVPPSVPWLLGASPEGGKPDPGAQAVWFVGTKSSTCLSAERCVPPLGASCVPAGHQLSLPAASACLSRHLFPPGPPLASSLFLLQSARPG